MVSALAKRSNGNGRNATSGGVGAVGTCNTHSVRACSALMAVGPPAARPRTIELVGDPEAVPDIKLVSEAAVRKHGRRGAT